MDYSIEFNERIGVSDHVRAETEIDAVIYLREFQRHRVEFRRTGDEFTLIFAFIFLQVYAECFLHQNMRRLVELEFKPPRDTIRDRWLQKEARKASEKIDDFAILFFDPVPKSVQRLTDTIKNRFREVSYVRNLFVHGHKVAAWSDSSGNSGETPARSLLTAARLIMAKKQVDELGFAWNLLLDELLRRCKTLRRVDDFKYSGIMNANK